MTVYKSVFPGSGYSAEIFFIASLVLLFSAFRSDINVETHALEAESAEFVGGSLKEVDFAASGNYSVRLTKSGAGLKFTDLPASSKVAITYASVNVGTISVKVDNKPAQKVNVHSSGAVTKSFLKAIIANNE